MSDVVRSGLVWSGQVRSGRGCWSSCQSHCWLSDTSGVVWRNNVVFSQFAPFLFPFLFQLRVFSLGNYVGNKMGHQRSDGLSGWTGRHHRSILKAPSSRLDQQLLREPLSTQDIAGIHGDGIPIWLLLSILCG